MVGCPEIADKLMTADEAVSRFIRDGCQLAIGGFSITRNPMAIAYEIVRQRVRDLHIVCHSHGQALDVLIGAGCVKRLEIAYGGNGRYAPTCVRFRKAVERSEIQFEDYSNFQISLRFLAGSLGMPFIPSRSGLGSDILGLDGFTPEVRAEPKVACKKYAKVQNPFREDEEVVLLPPLTPDVSVIHAQYVGDDGTVRIKGLTFVDVEQAKAADAVIVTCEEIVPRSFIREDPDENCLPAFFVKAIVKVPYGAHPTDCFNFYDYDPMHLNMYHQMAADDERFEEYLDAWVYGVRTWEEYLEKVGVDRLLEIKANPTIGYAPGLVRK